MFQFSWWTETTGTHAIASYYLENTTNRGGILQMVSGKMQFVGRIGTTTTYTSGSGTTNVADGKWHHVVGTVDNGVWKVYVDGQLESTSSTSVAGNFTGLVQKMNVGRVNTTGTTYTSWAKACIKEVSMWNYTKAAAEIETNFEDYVGYTGSETGLKGYWKVSEGSGTNYDDVTSQSNDLTTTGSPSWSNDAMVDYYTADVQSYSDYFPFGMALPGRSGSVEDYRYGMSGMEEDSEIKGEGNSYDFGARMYDPRIGRFLSIDPQDAKYPMWSPYLYAANSPIVLIDFNGEGPIDPQTLVDFKCSIETAEKIEFTLYVSQPVEGARETHSGSDVGHTFVGIRTTQADGTVQEVIMGFYPNEGGAFFKDCVDGVVEDDGGHGYNIQQTTVIDKNQATAIVDYSIGVIEGDVQYCLEEYNCTNYGVECAELAGIEIDATAGQWPGGEGLNPGDLGEDIRDKGDCESGGAYAPETNTGVIPEETTTNDNESQKKDKKYDSSVMQKSRQKSTKSRIKSGKQDGFFG